jgi:trimeric autotransporter adhesin
MFKNKRKLQLLATLATLFLLAFGVGCKGFFVNPTLTGVQVGPTATIQQTKTVQESATGTYDDGTTKTLNGTVIWSIADSSGTDVATISPGGLVTGANVGTATVTGAVGPLSGTSTITVTLSNLTSIQVTPTGPVDVPNGSSQQFNAFANGGSENISTSVTWQLSLGSVQGVSIDNTGLLSTTTGDKGTITLQAIDPSNTSIASVPVTVNIQ